MAPLPSTGGPRPPAHPGPRPAAAALAALLALPGLLGAQGRTAAAVTEERLGMDRALRLLFAEVWPGEDPAEARGARCLFVLIDPTPSVAASPFVALLERRLRAQPDFTRGCALGLGAVGRPRRTWLAPGAEPAQVLAAARRILAAKDDGFHDVCQAVRQAVPLLTKSAPRRALLLVSFENADLENRLEATAQLLAKKGIRCYAITAEAMLADSWWSRHAAPERPRGTTLRGGDAPFIDVPWGWLLQVTPANELSPAGFGPYAFARLAAASGGRVFLHAAAGGEHDCAPGAFTYCPFCRGTGDHAPAAEIYRAARLAQLAPSVEARARALKEAMRDPWFRALRKAWLQAWKAGLCRSRPDFAAGTSASGLARGLGAGRMVFRGSLNFESNAAWAEKLAARCAELGARYAKELAQIPQGAGNPRHRAAAEVTHFALALTHANLLGYAGFCREVAPRWLAQMKHAPAPPERAFYDPPRRPAGIGVGSLSLCHGVEPYFGVELPGGPAFTQALSALDREFKALDARYAHTPFGMWIRRLGLARFYFVFPALTGPIPRRRPSSKREGGPETGGRRPARPARPTGRRAGGPQTGGGR